MRPVHPRHRASFLAAFAATSILTACGPGSRGPEGDLDAGGVGPDGSANECTPGLRYCAGNEVHTCTADGHAGPVVETCLDSACDNGSCTAAPPACSVEGIDKIYVVDQGAGFWRFDPVDNTFFRVGTLNCPDLGSPFSMAVDRDGIAWVLYSSGSIYHVSTTDASCESTTWPVGQLGYFTFGMAFVVDEPEGNDERLWVAASDQGSTQPRLGVIDPATMGLTDLGLAYWNNQYSPELTGTGAAQLYAYYPGSAPEIALLDAAAPLTPTQVWQVPSLGDNITVAAWAFASWGGQLFMFVTVDDTVTFERRQSVYRMDPATGETVRVVPERADLPIVGAGVSTCAPIVIP